MIAPSVWHIDTQQTYDVFFQWSYAVRPTSILTTQALARIALGRIRSSAKTARVRRPAHLCVAEPYVVRRMLQRSGTVGFARLGGRRPL